MLDPSPDEPEPPPFRPDRLPEEEAWSLEPVPDADDLLLAAPADFALAAAPPVFAVRLVELLVVEL